MEREIEPDFLELMPAAVLIFRVTGKDDVGNRTYDVPQVWRCRIESTKKRLSGISQAGTVVHKTITETVLIGPYFEPTLTPGDRLVLPNGAQRAWSAVDASEVFWDEVGPHHTILTLGSTT